LGQRVFGLTDWYRNGTLAEYVAVEARNLASLPGDVDFTVGASLPISGLTAWQGLFQHGRLQAGQSVLAHGAAGAVGSMVTQLAREAGAYVIGSGRSADSQKVLDFGANDFIDLENDVLEDIGKIDLVFDVIGGNIGKRSAGLIRSGGILVSVVGPVEAAPVNGLAVDFVVESNRDQLGEMVRLFDNSENPSEKIVLREFGCGATDSGSPALRVCKIKTITPYLIWVTKTDTTTIDRQVWKRAKENSD
jgi:NADPH:quinone reductase-like Zn-dependent oxidoreductase